MANHSIHDISIHDTIDFDKIDFYKIFSLEEKFNIDIDYLTSKYFALLQDFHPDKFSSYSMNDKHKSMIITGIVNDGFAILKNPRKRGEYLLFKHGIYVNSDKDNIFPTTVMLEEIMKIREDIENINNIDELDKLKDQLIGESSNIIASFESIYDIDKVLAANNLIKLRYLEKSVEEIKIKKKGINNATT